MYADDDHRGHALQPVVFPLKVVMPVVLEAWINWRKALEFVDSGSVASTSEMAVLDLTVAIGENRYKFSIMGPAHSRLIAQAVASALGEDR
jgi:hypothetical protein